MKIAFTHNLKLSDREDEAEFDTPATVDALCRSLARLGHDVEPVEVSGPASRTVARLEALNPDLVFNTAEGRTGRFREAFFPALFDQLGIPYTGSDAYVCALTLDKQLTKMVVAASGVPTPGWRFLTDVQQIAGLDLNYPLIVKPNFEGSSKGIGQNSVVENPAELKERVTALFATYPSGILVEEFIRGRDVVVPFLEKASPATKGVLTPAEYDFDLKLTGPRKYRIYDYELKNKYSDAVSVKVPADLTAAAAKEIRALSETAYRVLGVRDLGRIDFRVTDDGRLYFIEINALPSLEPGAGIYSSAELAGLKSMEDVLAAVIVSAAERNGILGKLKEKKKRGTGLKVGLTYNMKRVLPGGEGEDDQEAEYDSPKTIEAVRAALASFGHEVVGLEATPELPTILASSGVDVVFNIAEGIKGRNREAQVPAMLELLDIPYTGSDPATLALALDKGLAKRIVRQAGVTTPNWFPMSSKKDKIPKDMSYPLIVKPIAEGSSKGVIGTSVVYSESELRDQVALIREKYGQPALIEEFLAGREFTVGLLGERRPRVLPPMEIVFLNSQVKHPVYSFAHKLEWSKEIRYDAPAQIDAKLAKEIERVAKICFAALDCRDVARIDLRLDNEGRVNFIECNPLPGLTPDWSDLCLIAKSAGMDYRTLIGEILAPAIKRFKEREREQRERNPRNGTAKAS